MGYYLNKNYIQSAVGGYYYVKTASGVLPCKTRGVLKNNNVSPATGDYVELDLQQHTPLITAVVDRKNLLIRPSVANVDILFIVVSTLKPKPNYLTIDILTAMAYANGITPVVLCTKNDVQQESELYLVYAKAGIEVLNANSESGLARIKQLIDANLCVFTGNSGVGKSTLLNKLSISINAKTGEISEKLGRGKHTTTITTLHEVHGGVVADTPGFSTVDVVRLINLPKDELAFTFPEMREYINSCQFTGCSHIKEKGCAVIDALNKGEICASRYDSYVAIYSALKQVNEWERRT